MKQKIPLLPRNLALVTFGELLIVFLTKVNPLHLLHSMVQRCYLLHLIKQNLDDTGISFPVVPSITNLKLHNISLTPKMVKKVIMDLDMSKASGPDCFPVVVLKNYDPKISYILTELFNKCLKKSCFPDCWRFSRFHQWSLYLRMLVKGLQLKTTALLVFFLWLGRSFKNL